MRFDNKVVVITGASSGIGRELAFQLATRKCRIVLAARDTAALAAVAERARALGGQAVVAPTDVAIRSQVERMIRVAVSEYGRVDVLINNAGVSKGRGTILTYDETDVRGTMDVNYMGCVYGVWAAAPVMEQNGGGMIVFVSSIVGKRGIAGSFAYCASKFAVQGLTESIRPELARKNIRVVTICPAGVDTAFFANNGRDERARFRLHPVEKIARLTIAACEKEKREALLTLDAGILHWGNVFFPRLMDWAITKRKRF